MKLDYWDKKIITIAIKHYRKLLYEKLIEEGDVDINFGCDGLISINETLDYLIELQEKIEEDE